MSPVFSPDIIARVKDETDIVEVVGRYVQLKAAGSVHKGLCPFHKEKTPSFIVTASRQRYHCFGCGTGGDIFTFLMEMEQLSFPEAVETLARPLDIDLSEWLREDEGEGERRAFHRANEAAMDAWREALWEDGPGRTAHTYLRDRGFGDKVLRDFDVGYAPPGGSWLAPRLAKAGVDEELALAADLLRRGETNGTFAYFRGRIIFPVRSISRQVVGFGGRVIDQGEPKYLNSADSTYFTKGKLLYGFDASRMAIAREKTALLVEGYLDLLALVQAGFNNVVATCGTAFTPDQARLLRRGAPRVKLLFDGDKAGLKAAVRASDTALKCGLDPRIVSLPAGEDPASLLEKGGAEAMQEVLAADVGYVPFLKSLTDAKGGGREVTERAARQALSTASGVNDPLRREYLLQETGEVFGLSREVLEATLAGMKETPLRRPAADGPAPDEGPPEAEPAAEPPRRSRVRPLERPDVARWEKDLFLHVLRDDTGGAARAFLDGSGDLEFAEETSRLLAGEIASWAEAARGGQRVLPREFVEQRWNQHGDAGYRNFVSRLLNEEDCPTHTDFVQVVTDLIRRLTEHRQRARRS